MTIGVVNADHEPVIRIQVRDISGRDHERTAIVDTGFTGWLTLPPDFIAELGLVWRELGAAILADGSRVLFDDYDATVLWDRNSIPISVDEADSEPLVGMQLMYGYRILIEDVDGGIVRIDPIGI